MVFPGHGAEQPRMGLALASVHPRSAALLEHAGAVGGFDARTVLRRAGDRLADTRVLQPLMSAVLLGIVAALADLGVRPDLALGYSLGELSAWSALGGVRAEQAIELAGVRGRALGAIASEHEGAMLVLPLLDEPEVQAAIELGCSKGLVDRAIHVEPKRWVLSGDPPALVEILESYGGSFVPTTGAWHSRRMSPARVEFGAALQALEPSICPTPTLICNHDGAVLAERSIVPCLLDQIDGTFEFVAAMQTLAATLDADGTLILVGPPKPLRALIRANWPEHPRLLVAETPREIAEIGEVLRC